MKKSLPNPTKISSSISTLNFKKALLPMIIASLAMTGCGGGGSSSTSDNAGSSSSSSSGGGGGAGGGGNVGGVTLTTTLLINGGDASAEGAEGEQGIAVGGNGGFVQVRKRHGAGDIIFTDQSQPEVTFEPTVLTADFGESPLLITQDTTIFAQTAEPSEGEYYLFEGAEGRATGIFLSDGDGTPAEPEERITGLSIAEGTTLTLNTQDAGGQTVQINLNDDASLAGAIALTGGLNRIDINSHSFIGLPTGVIDVSKTEPDERGGSLIITAQSHIINASTLSADGGADTQGFFGGGAGTITLTGVELLENTGAISANGMDNDSTEGGEGGRGGRVTLTSLKTIYNTGSIEVNGGAGVSGANGGTINILAEEAGSVVQFGNLIAHGGDSLDARGGNGGRVRIDSNGGDVYFGGSYAAIGGDAVTASSNPRFSPRGGRGGSLNINLREGSQSPPPSDSPTRGEVPASVLLAPGNLLMVGEIDISGGDAPEAIFGGEGGEGGTVSVNISGSSSSMTESSNVIFAYGEINISGGQAANGGSGGTLRLENAPIRSGLDSETAPAAPGAIRYGINTDLSGGDTLNSDLASPASGGTGGSVFFGTGFEGFDGAEGGLIPEMSVSSIFENTAQLNLQGGIAHGNDSSGRSRSFGQSEGGSLNVIADTSINNLGTILVNGGNDLINNEMSRGGFSGAITFTTLGSFSNTGTLELNGGNGELEGGGAGELNIDAESVSSVGTLSLDGGDANAAVASSTGGDAGIIEAYLSTPNTRVDFSTGVSNSPGTGETQGGAGYIFDGVECTGECENFSPR